MPGQNIYNRYKILGHVIFWLLSFTLLVSIFYFYDRQIYFDLLAKAAVTNIGFAIGVYVNLYLLIPRFLKQKNYVFYIFWLVVLLTLASLFIQLLFMFPLRNLLHITEQFKSFDTNLHSAFFFSMLVYVITTSFLKFIKDWLSIQDLNLKLAKTQQQKLQAELKTLKGQLNPHFLFNSLNNIYSLSLIKSEKVPDLILRLSDLMRHIIYESRENFISLTKELNFVENFIALQKIRTAEQSKINYQILGTIPDAKIAPLLFEPFIDNAFKHGLPGTHKNDFISIVFNFEESDYLQFSIKNNYEKLDDSDKKHSGIGIQNVKQRLKLLYKSDEYTLDILKNNLTYNVQLKLKLK